MAADSRTQPNVSVPPAPPEDVFAQFVNLAQERNRLDDKRLQLQERALEFTDTQDQRQFEFHSKSRDQHHERSTRRSEFGRRFLWALLAAVIVVTCVFLWFLFVGDERQTEIALSVLKTLLTAVGGYGVIHSALHAFRWLMGPRD